MRLRKMMLLCLTGTVLCTGCSNLGRGPVTEIETEFQTAVPSTGDQTGTEDIAEGYRNIYEEAVRKDSLDTLEVQEEIIEYLGEAGYAAVDRDDQINMTNHTAVQAFCKSAKEGKEDTVTIFSVMAGGEFIRYDMNTYDGEIDVALSSLRWEDGEPKVYYHHKFTADSWKYTQKGYFFIDEYHPPGYDGPPGELAFRVEPLDEKCRELNRQYVYSVGYVRNNLLITDWSEEDYSALDVYDLYETLYYLKYRDYVPYETYEGAEYAIPAGEFEEVLQSYFKINRAQIALNAVFDPEGQTYRYRPRGLQDSEAPYEPYPEVVGCEEQDDGTLRLFVEAVWERQMTDRAVASELVVRPLADGGFQYVSNKVLAWDEGLEFQWYSPRL